MNLTKHTLCTHVRSEVSGLHIRLNLTVLTMGPLGLGGFFPPRLPFGFPWVPLQVIRSVVEIRPNFLRFFSASIRLFLVRSISELFVAVFTVFSFVDVVVIGSTASNSLRKSKFDMTHFT